jgi:hypothetical protein
MTDYDFFRRWNRFEDARGRQTVPVRIGVKSQVFGVKPGLLDLKQGKNAGFAVTNW